MGASADSGSSAVGSAEEADSSGTAAGSSSSLSSASSSSPGGAAAVTVKRKLPSIGWASGAATIQRTPTSPPANGSLNRRVNVRLSVVVISSGVRIVPSGSSTMKPSPAGAASPANVKVISVTGSSITSPSAGEDDSKPVWAAAGLALKTMARMASNSPAATRKFVIMCIVQFYYGM